MPQVVSHRLARIALAGPVLSERDRREFSQMILEKQAAFAEAWLAMTLEAVRANQALVGAMLGNWLNPFSALRPPTLDATKAMQQAAIGILGKGLAPVHRKAVSNARRLGKTKLR